jgi:hypothetical protein
MSEILNWFSEADFWTGVLVGVAVYAALVVAIMIYEGR